ncbi:hypothetical protein OG194_29040 [Streptomyces sp. NBC_01288]|uniref:hypothetical protein n=1 Tax=Streptomyces sp. NBC_01288 TaxID=2903814 RepID=UPI002E135C3B|nr:hypothetical protein OG194_29040 [Streptomyces sp. NBC_01288]
MEEPSEDDEESSSYPPPHSQRELGAVLLELAAAPTVADRKRIFDKTGMTVEEFGEHFGPYGFGLADFTD